MNNLNEFFIFYLFIFFHLILFWQVLNKLKVLNLEGSKCLIRSPNFLQVPHLEILILEGCTSLIEVHESIGDLKKLVFLNLQDART
jgi:hypothetical protein